MARQVGLHLISKLRHDSELYLPYQGSDRRRQYGERLRPRHNLFLIEVDAQPVMLK